MMEFETIPGTRLKVSRVAAGTWAIGGWMWRTRFLQTATCAAGIRNSKNPGSASISPPSRASMTLRKGASAKESFTWPCAGCSTEVLPRRSGAARRPGQLQAVDGVSGWTLDAATMAEIDRILRDEITERVGPEFMTLPA